MKALQLEGKRFGALLAIRRVGSSPDRKALWLCRCRCGKQSIVTASNLKKGSVRSCGCVGREKLLRRNRSHGMSKTPTYRSWKSMRRRCHDPRAVDYQRYGGSGISVCERWRSSFEAFLADMGKRPPGTTIDRIDGSRGYEPGNCRWATSKQQRRNSQNVKLNRDLVKLMRFRYLFGEKPTRIARSLGVNPQTAYAAIRGRSWL